MRVMIRPISPTDLPALVELLRWMDADPARRALAPEGRTIEDLAFEVEEGWVEYQGDRLSGFAALVPFWRGAAIEGPVSRGDPAGLLKAAEAAATERGVPTLYAFPTEENATLRAALEAAEFGPVHTTYFYITEPRELPFPVPEGVTIEEVFALDPEEYRTVYKESDEGWSLRLAWSDLELLEHFAEPDCRLWFAYQNGEPVGMVEVETLEDAAEVAYLGVIPKARGQGIGQALLAVASKAALETGARWLRVRAHDHEKEARRLYERLGFSPLEAVVTYAKETQAPK